jgi:alkyl hydroperoxide reductase subunit AhpC
VFVIGADKKVKLTITYPASTGRNFDEILRKKAQGKIVPSGSWTGVFSQSFSR